MHATPRYNGESAGLPPELMRRVPSSGADRNAYDETKARSALDQASMVTEWGRQGVTFIRTGIEWAPPWEPDQRFSHNHSDLITLLDAAASAGVAVLVEVGLDTLAIANATSTIRGGSNSTDLTACPDTNSSHKGNYCAFVHDAIVAVRHHPAVAGSVHSRMHPHAYLGAYLWSQSKLKLHDTVDHPNLSATTQLHFDQHLPRAFSLTCVDHTSQSLLTKRLPTFGDNTVVHHSLMLPALTNARPHPPLTHTHPRDT